jgi:hypothetical protein
MALRIARKLLERGQEWIVISQSSGMSPRGLKGLDPRRRKGEIPTMQTLKADPKQRVRIPDAKPGQVFAYEKLGEGHYSLTLVIKSKRRPRFPRGSLLNVSPANWAGSGTNWKRNWRPAVCQGRRSENAIRSLGL